MALGVSGQNGPNVVFNKVMALLSANVIAVILITVHTHHVQDHILKLIIVIYLMVDIISFCL